MAARKEAPSQKAMLKTRVGSLTKELAALNKAGKASSETFHKKLDRLHKYQKALQGPRKVEPIDYAAYRETRARVAKGKGKASTGTKAVATLMKSGLKGPLRSVLDRAKKGAASAQAKTPPAEGSKGGVSREAYEKHIRPRK